MNRMLKCVLSFLAVFLVSVVYLGYIHLDPSFAGAAWLPAILGGVAGHFCSDPVDRKAKNGVYLSWVVLSVVLCGLFFGLGATVGA